MCIEWRDGDLYLRVRIQPRASRDQIAGVSDARLRIRVTAPPVDNAANRHLQEFLAKEFGVAKSRVEVIQGHASRNKRILIRQPRRRPGWLQDIQGN